MPFRHNAGRGLVTRSDFGLEKSRLRELLHCEALKRLRLTEPRA